MTFEQWDEWLRHIECLTARYDWAYDACVTSWGRGNQDDLAYYWLREQVRAADPDWPAFADDAGGDYFWSAL